MWKTCIPVEIGLSDSSRLGSSLTSLQSIVILYFASFRSGIFQKIDVGRSGSYLCVRSIRDTHTNNAAARGLNFLSPPINSVFIFTLSPLSESLFKVNLSSRIPTGCSREAASNVKLYGESILPMCRYIVSLGHLSSKKFLAELQ